MLKLHDIEFSGIDFNDYPDFCDAYIIEASIEENGKFRPLNEKELDEVNSDSSLIYEELMKYLY